jgi:hypothetical protein
METSNSLTILGIVLLAIIALFLIFREAVLWYYRINERTELLQEIKAYLMLIAKAENPEGYKKFQEAMHLKPRKSKGKTDSGNFKDSQT